MRGGQEGGDQPAASTDGAEAAVTDGPSARLGTDAATRLRQPEGAGVRWGGPPSGGPAPRRGRGERASRIVLRLGRILAFLPSLLASSQPLRLRSLVPGGP